MLEYAYYLGLSAKRLFAMRNRRRLPCRVVSIGNITVGGTGKTPATLAVAEEALRRGFRPVILTRGYKGRAKGPCVVTRGGEPLLSAVEAGDEPYLMAERLRGVPIVKGSDRYKAGLFALKEFDLLAASGAGPSPVLFVLDDGFQHWRLCRDRDVVLIDAGNPFGNRRLLPMGRLREPLTELKRADVIAVTKARREDPGLIAEIRRYNPDAPVFFTEHHTEGVKLRSGEKRPPAWLRGKRVFCFCGIADPASFRDTVAAAGAVIAGMKTYPDHHAYSQEDIASIGKDCRGSGAEFLVTTEKDMARTGNLDLPANILIIEIAFIAGQPFFDRIFS